MASRVTIEGVKEVTARLEKINQTATNAVEQALLNSALMVERDAKIKVPVDTGRLRNSLTHATEGFGSQEPAVRVGTNVHYAKFVEFGTSKQSAQPYLYPALIENKSKILNELAKAMKKGCGL